MNNALRPRTLWTAGLVLAAVLGALIPPAVSAPSPAARTIARTVLNNGPWPPYTATGDQTWAAYAHATGTTKALLGKIVLRPRVIWFTSRTQTGHADVLIRRRIDDFQHGNPTAYAQLALFGMYPSGEARRTDPISVAQQAKYRAWIDQIAAGIGGSRVIMVLEPDLAVAWGGWHPEVRFAMAAYAAHVLGALPNTKIYLDGSDADWLQPDKAVTMLLRSGIADVDGIALGATHYSSTSGNIRYGADLVGRLAKAGVRGKTVVIDTADNAEPFTPAEFKARFPHGSIGNANVCRTKIEIKCVTLGIPPTTDVASARWHLSAADRKLAATYVDAFLWFGRPWLYKQAAPFQLSRALAVASTTPY